MGKRNWLASAGGGLGGGAGSAPAWVELTDDVFSGSLVDPNTSGLLTSLTYAASTGWSALYAGVTPASDASGATEFPGLEAAMTDVLSDDFDWDTYILQIRIEVLALSALGFRTGVGWGIEDSGGTARGVVAGDQVAAANTRPYRLTASTAQNTSTPSGGNLVDVITTLEHQGGQRFTLASSMQGGSTVEYADNDNFLGFDTDLSNETFRIGAVFRTGGTALAVHTDRFRIFKREILKGGRS